MKRLHVHVAVADLDESVRFYRTLFGAEPTVLRTDYAKWMLDDPRVNFAVSTRSGARGLEHLGMQVDSEAELAEVRARLDAAALPAEAESGVACCYARSDKHWTTDPQGIAWETFRTLGSVPTYNGAENAEGPACCTPNAARG